MKSGVTNHALSFYGEKSEKKLDKTLTTFTINYSIVFEICQNIPAGFAIGEKLKTVSLKMTEDLIKISPGYGFPHHFPPS
jgi:hypothetical protein